MITCILLFLRRNCEWNVWLLSGIHTTEILGHYDYSSWNERDRFLLHLKKMPAPEGPYEQMLCLRLQMLAELEERPKQCCCSNPNGSSCLDMSINSS
jgi:hypothetical protein